MGEQLELAFAPHGVTIPREGHTSLVKTVHNQTNNIMRKFTEDVGTFRFIIQSSDITYDDHTGKIKRITLKAKEGGVPKGVFEIYIENYTISNRKNSSSTDVDDFCRIVEGLKFSSITKTDKAQGGVRFGNKQGENIQTFEYFRYIFGENITKQIKKRIENAILFFSQQNQ